MGLRDAEPTPPGKIRQNNKEGRSPRISAFQTPRPALPTITGRSGTHQMYTMNIFISLFILGVYRIVLHTLESRDHYPHFIGGKQWPGETGGVSPGDATVA